MIRLTRAQRVALLAIYERHIVGRTADSPRLILITQSAPSYRAFRRTVRPLLGGSDCAMVEAAGMWVGIEPDGYTHT